MPAKSARIAPAARAAPRLPPKSGRVILAAQPRIPVSHRLALLVLLTALPLAPGCATTNPYVAFADAGSAYAARLDEVLIAAEKSGIDATSWRLLDSDGLSNTTVQAYTESSDSDRARAAVLRRLRHHGDVLARYFGGLSQLASTDAPQRASDAAGKAHGAIETAWNDASALGEGLRTNLAFPPAQAVTETGKVIVGQIVKGALRKELELRGDLIAREIATQEALLATIADTVSHDLRIGQAVAERLLVLDPLLADAPISSPESWVATRQRILTAEQTIEEVRAARAAARALRETFEALASGTAGDSK